MKTWRRRSTKRTVRNGGSRGRQEDKYNYYIIFVLRGEREELGGEEVRR
jgi:hypothetical protein